MIYLKRRGDDILNEMAEALKGFTDIPIALISLLFFILLLKGERNEWRGVFLLTTVAAFMGAAVHILKFENSEKTLIWVILYVLLFELIRRFSLAMINFITEKNSYEKSAVYLFESVLYLTAVFGLFYFPKYDIFALVAFSALAFIRVSVCLFKTKRPKKSAVLLMFILLLPIVLQALSKLIPYAVVFEHIIIALALFIGFKIAKSSAADSAQ